MSNKKKKRKVTFEEYQKELDKRAIKTQKQLKYVAILIALFILQIFILSFFYIFRRPYVLPFLVLTGIFWLTLILITIFRSHHCPGCRRFFSRGELVLFDTVKGKGDIFGPGGDWQYYDSSKRVYWTECKYCGHLIWVIKG